MAQGARISRCIMAFAASLPTTVSLTRSGQQGACGAGPSHRLKSNLSGAAQVLAGKLEPALEVVVHAKYRYAAAGLYFHVQIVLIFVRIVKVRLDFIRYGLVSLLGSGAED